MSANLVALAYLIASVFFILALKGLSSPITARRGNLFGMVGMVIAVFTTLTITKNWVVILACIAIGGTIGGGARFDGATAIVWTLDGWSVGIQLAARQYSREVASENVRERFASQSCLAVCTTESTSRQRTATPIATKNRF